MSVVTGHHDIWYQATHVTVVINATTNWELERPKPHYPPPPHPTFRDNMSDKHLSQAQGPFETFYKSKSRGK